MKDGKIGYGGPTYIATRSGKHDSSTAKIHSFDFNRLTELDEFKSAMMTSSGEVKPIVFVSVDGGPDESPGNSTRLASWCHTFCEHKLDALFVFCNASGLSA